MPKLLSKSTFMYGCQCQKRLYLHKFKPEVADPYDEQAMQIFRRGTDVGVLAQELFPGGIDAQGTDNYPGFETARRTASYMKSEQGVIYEATFIYKDVLCAVDILVKTPTGYEAYEVKSTNSAKPQHMQDGALQYFVLKGAGVPIEKFHILHFDSTYVRRGELEIDKLFKATDITRACLKNQDSIGEQVVQFHNLLAAGNEPDIPMGKQCEKPYPCNFQGYCTQLNPIEDSAILPLDSTIFYNEGQLNSFFKHLEYPLYFFDFETVMYGVPEYDESRPYQQLPFQYSLHVIEEEGGTLVHREFLANAAGEPREELIKNLLRDLGDKGSILVWYQPFEEGRLRELARDFPQYESPLLHLIERLKDLIIPFKDGMVECEAFQGSSSIKKVLPVMVPDLTYDTLTIKEGATASFIFGQLSSMETEEAEQTKKDLLAYCKLDTLAMVKIWELMKGSIEG